MRSPVNNICRFAAALYLGLMAASCSGNTQPGLEAGSAQHTGTLPAEAPIASPAALSALPSVASLPLSPRVGSYVEADLIRTGEQYDQSLPNARVQVFSAPELNFMPNWQGESNGLQSTAFAVYHFNAPGYDRNGQVYLDWAQNPLDPYLIWIGLSDWQKGQWKWFQHQPGGYIDTGDLTPFFSPGGDLYMTIVAEGFFQVDLQEIRLGLPAPIIQWQASPTIGTAPLLVSFDASQSLPPLGLIEKYEWDPEGDGSFVEGDINGLFEFTYQDAGVFDAAVKVTNTVGSYSVASIPITVHKNWLHTLGRSGIDEFTAAVTDSHEYIYLAGSSDDPGGSFYQILLCKLDSNGELLWARRYSANGSAFANALDLDSDGNVLLSGSQAVTGASRDCLLQKWSPEGLLLWSRSFGGATFDRLLDVQCGSDGIYACGEGNGNILAVKADGNGDLVWTRSRDGGSGDYAKAMVLKSDLTGTTTGMSIVGQRSISSVSHLWRVDYQANGSFSKAQTLGSAQTPLEGHAIDFSFNFIGATSRYTISGIVNVAGEQQPFLLDFMDSESSTYGLRLTGANFVEASAFHPDGAGGYYLAGFFFDVSNLGAVMHLGSAGEYLGGFQLGAGGDQGARCYGLLPFQEGLLSWGKANSASQAWSALALSAQPFSQTWADNNGADAALSWSSTDSLGDSFIADDELTLDSGAGLEDAMASYLPLP